MKRLIDAGHLKDEIMKAESGSWYDLYQLLGMVDNEPTEKWGIDLKMVIGILIVAVLLIAFWVFLARFF